MYLVLEIFPTNDPNFRLGISFCFLNSSDTLFLGGGFAYVRTFFRWEKLVTNTNLR